MMEKYLSLNASAGSGKTFALSVRYISLLYLGASTKEILTMTFTKKACKEMSDKILKNLDAILDESDTSVLNEIAKSTGLSTQSIKDNQKSIKEKFLKEPNSIMTLDAFYTNILKEFSFEAGIGGSYDISSELDIDEFKEYFYKKLYKTQKNGKNYLQDYKDLLKLLDCKPNYVLDKILKPYRSDNLSNLKPLDDSDFEQHKKQLEYSAFAFKDAIADFEGILSDRAVSSVDYKDINGFLSKTKKAKWILKDHFTDYSYYKKIPQEHYDGIQKIFESLKQARANYLISLNNKKSNMIMRIIKLYNQERDEFAKKTKTLCFDDLACFASKLLTSDNITNDFIYFRLDFKIKHILIDEFQDTSIKQYDILKPLISNIVSGFGTSDEKSFFYVGDCKQSIYGWRGGFEALFNFVSDEFTQIEKDSLKFSYRSAPNIVNFVNNAFMGIKDYEYEEQTPAKKADDCKNNYVEIVNIPQIQDDDDVVDVYENIIEQIGKLHSLNIKNIAVLSGTNKVLGELSELLDKHNIAYSYGKKTLLTDTISVKAIINAITYLYLTKDINASSLSATELEEASAKFLIYKIKFNSLIDSDDLLDDITINNNDDHISKFTLQELIFNISYKYNILDENIMQLLTISYKYKTISQFVYEIEQLEDEVAKQKDKDGCVILSTIHASKGLEFECVIVVDHLGKNAPINKTTLIKLYDDLDIVKIYNKNDDLLSIDDGYAKAKSQEDERYAKDQLNRAYVALTRAKDIMFIYKREQEDKSNYYFLNDDMIDAKNNKLNKVDANSYDIDEPKEVVEFAQVDIEPQNEPSSYSKLDDEEIRQSQNYGKAMHYVLENMREFSQESISYAIRKAKNNNTFSIDDSIIESIETAIKTLINDKEFVELTNGDKYFEQEYVHNNERKIIDLLVIKDSSCVVIDYKTSNENTNVEKNNKQVKEYCEFIQQATNKPTKGYLIHLSSDNIKIKNVTF